MRATTDGPTRMRLSKPVIAAVSGYAVAGGLELACWCDLRIVEEGASWRLLSPLGVPLIDGGTVRLPRLIGQSRAMDMILTGRAVGAEAYAFGLANRVVPNAKPPRAERLAAQIAQFPQMCMKAIDCPCTNNGPRLPACDAQRIRPWHLNDPDRRGPQRRRRFAGAKGAAGGSTTSSARRKFAQFDE